MSGPSGEPAGGRLFRGAAAYRPATPWRPVAALLATASIVAVSILGARFLPPYLGLDFGVSTHPTADDITTVGLWVVGIFQVLAIGLTVVAGTLFGGRLADTLALRAPPRGWRAYAGAVLAMAMLQAVLATVQQLLLEHDMLKDLRPFVGPVTGPYWPLAVAVLGVGAPLSEELLFRGFLLGALAKSRLGFLGAALISTALWTGLHAGYSLVGLAEVFSIGLLLAWLLWRTGSLWVTIFCHGLYNSLVALALRLVELPP
ncbi:MAG: CPBP family intramembrane metalloprotease [Hyphomicrobiaceae bacterium]|nr:CPBP family intramembrane metalloprotease [Hyphomicrobiaceae bacterium]